MGRTVVVYRFNAIPQGLSEMVHNYLISEEYTYKLFENEYVYQKGSGWTMGPTFFKLTYLNYEVVIEAWMKSAILPGVYAGEITVEDFLGCAVKGPFAERLARIENMMRQFGGYPASYGNQMPYQQVPYQHTPYQPVQQYSQPPVQYGAGAAQTFQSGVCRRCGAALVPEAKFCVGCGEKI